jgi:Cys-tRNA synthase (O-phospho-L-seryl-tRNA:Cys-tRNA synthase)
MRKAEHTSSGRADQRRVPARLARSSLDKDAIVGVGHKQLAICAKTGILVCCVKLSWHATMEFHRTRL